MKLIKSKGFTLIEVLVALSIFAVLAVSAGQVIGQSAVGMVALEERMLARQVASNTMNQLLSGELSAQKGESELTVEFADRKWLVRYESQAVPSETYSKVLNRVDLSVSLKENDDRVISALSMLITP